jgi:hypothetical protein
LLSARAVRNEGDDEGNRTEAFGWRTVPIRWGMTSATVDGQFQFNVYLSGSSEIRLALNLVVHKVVLWNVGLITLIIHTLSKLAALHFLAAASFLVLVWVLITSIQLASLSF